MALVAITPTCSHKSGWDFFRLLVSFHVAAAEDCAVSPR